MFSSTLLATWFRKCSKFSSKQSKLSEMSKLSEIRMQASQKCQKCQKQSLIKPFMTPKWVTLFEDYLNLLTVSVDPCCTCVKTVSKRVIHFRIGPQSGHSWRCDMNCVRLMTKITKMTTFSWFSQFLSKFHENHCFFWPFSGFYYLTLWHTVPDTMTHCTGHCTEHCTGPGRWSWVPTIVRTTTHYPITRALTTVHHQHGR